MEGHGGNIYKAQMQYGVDRRLILDYSANINPFGVPAELKRAILSEMDSLVNYPDPDCTALKSSIARYLGIAEDSIVIGNGASEIIFLLFDVLRPRKVLIPAPAFSEYARAAEAAGCRVEYFEMRQEEDFKLDVGGLCGAMAGGADAVFLCNPNNPTSRLLSVEELLIILKRAAEKDIYVIIDEAFIELTQEGNKASMARFVRDFPKLFVIRAFTKIFAIPGLRLGYGLGDRTLVRTMWERKLPWSVNSFACAIGGVLDMDGDYMEKTGAWIRSEPGRFYRELADGYSGLFKVYRPDTNFILIKILEGRFTAGQLRNELAKKGVLIRDASNFKYLDESFFRLAVKDRETNSIFLKELKEAAGKLAGQTGREKAWGK